jgi:hypothetical protein
MAVLTKQYKDINDTMKHLKVQIIDSIDYALKVTPKFKNPEELFYWLKKRTVYKNDFKNVELLQTMPTMFERNCHNISGAGDCDCFTITTVACMIAQNWDNIYIDLVGREKSNPVHIYSDIVWKGKRQVLDLTNKQFNFERPYPYRQRILIEWRKW